MTRPRALLFGGRLFAGRLYTPVAQTISKDGRLFAGRLFAGKQFAGRLWAGGDGPEEPYFGGGAGGLPGRRKRPAAPGPATKRQSRLREDDVLLFLLR